MKRLAFIISAITFASCTPEPIAQNNSYQSNQVASDCGLLVMIGEDQRGDYIIVKINDYVRNRYKVADYSIYYSKMNKQICNLSSFEQQPE